MGRDYFVGINSSTKANVIFALFLMLFSPNSPVSLKFRNNITVKKMMGVVFSPRG